jgi:hypothetical protein
MYCISFRLDYNPTNIEFNLNGVAVKILIQCAWCRKHLGEKESSSLENTAPLISHSICPECYVKFSDDTGMDTSALRPSKP